MFKAAVLTVSDRSFRGERPDAGGPLVVEILKNAGYAVTETALSRTRRAGSRLPCGSGATGSRWISSSPPEAPASPPGM